MLEKLVTAVDSVTGKLGLVETRLNALEGEARVNRATADAEPTSELDEPLFNAAGGARPKHRRIQQLGNDIEILDSGSDARISKRKKKVDKKASHAVKVMSKDYILKHSKLPDGITVKRKPQAAPEFEGEARVNRATADAAPTSELDEPLFNAAGGHGPNIIASSSWGMTLKSWIQALTHEYRSGRRKWIRELLMQ